MPWAQLTQRPQPHGPYTATVSPTEKQVDVFFAGRLETSAVRRAGVAELRALAQDGIRVDLASARLGRVEFYRVPR